MQSRIALPLYLLGMLLVGELVIRPFFGLTLSDIFFLSALAALVVETVGRPGGLRVGLPRTFLFGAVLFSVAGLVSSLYSIHIKDALDQLMRLSYVLIVWTWMGPQIIRSLPQLWLALRFWTVSCALSGGGAIVQLIFGDIIPNTHSVYGRMTGLTQHVNDLGGLTTIALVPAVMFATMPHSNRARRLLDIAICGLILAGLILSGSVTGFIAAGLGLGVWIVVTRPDRRLVAVIGAMLIAGVGVVVLQLLRHGTSPVARISAVLFGRESVATGAIRVQWDLSVLQVIWAHPFLGVGFDRISEASPTGHFVHNILLAVWLGGGLVALTGFVLMLGAAVRAAVDCVRQSWGEQKVMASALVAAFGASLVVGMAQPSLLSRYAWMPVAMLFVLRQLFLDRGLSEARSTVSTRPLDLSANTLRSN